MNTATPQPSPGALRAADALSNAGKLHRHPESAQKVTEAARMIDRETGTAELLAALESIADYDPDAPRDEWSEAAAFTQCQQIARDVIAKHTTGANVSERFTESITHANLSELRRQCDNLQAQVNELCAIVREFPAQITSARLDEREGKPTRYDYERAARACAVRV